MVALAVRAGLITAQIVFRGEQIDLWLTVKSAGVVEATISVGEG